MKRIIISGLDQYVSHEEMLDDILETLARVGWASKREVMEEWSSLLKIKLGEVTAPWGEA